MLLGLTTLKMMSEDLHKNAAGDRCDEMQAACTYLVLRNVCSTPTIAFNAGLPDFSWYNVPKRGKHIPNDCKITKCP
jgi:hypothetical protein